jgi:hypothetical protein
MKRLYLLMLFGGLLAGIAFFLPFTLRNPEAGIFSAGDSFKDTVNYNLFYLGVLKVDPNRILLGRVAALLEPAGVILLILGGLIALKLRRTGALCGLCGALFVLMQMIWIFTFLYGFYQAITLSTSFSFLGQMLKDWGSGYWLALIGGVLGLVGALAVWLERPGLSLPMRQPQGTPTLRLRPGAVVALCGAIVVAASVFVVPFFSAGQLGSLFDAFGKPYGLPFFWEVPLTLLLLLASGLVAFTGRKIAYLGSLSGALVGLTFLLLFLSPVFVGLETSFSEVEIGPGSAVMLIGCLLGLLGAVLGLLERLASSIPAEVQMAPLPS